MQFPLLKRDRTRLAEPTEDSRPIRAVQNKHCAEMPTVWIAAVPER